MLHSVYPQLMHTIKKFSKKIKKLSSQKNKGYGPGTCLIFMYKLLTCKLSGQKKIEKSFFVGELENVENSKQWTPSTDHASIKIYKIENSLLRETHGHITVYEKPRAAGHRDFGDERYVEQARRHQFQ